MKTSLIPKNIHSSWKKFITEDILTLLASIEKEIGDNYTPQKENVLRFLTTDLNNIKYIIVGMDPYPNYYEEEGILKPVATGRSFEVAGYYDWTIPTLNRSLVNILKCIYMTNNDCADIDIIREKIKDGTFNVSSPNELFDDLETQGILFLNTAFTVNKKPGSHMKYWKPFTKCLIEFIKKNNENVKWLLLGNDAKKGVSRYVDDDKVILSYHPSTQKFIENNIFKDLSDISWTGIKK